MSYWLVKSEPEEYSYSDLENDKLVDWTGVRNYQARNFLQQMKKDDFVFFYHSGKERSIVGIATVANEFFPDPTTDSDKWVAVKLKSYKKLINPVTLEVFKTNEKLKDSYLVKQSRLSVLPLDHDQFSEVLTIAGLDLSTI